MTNDYAKRLRNVRYAAKLHRRHRKPGIFCFHISCSTVGFLSSKARNRAVRFLNRRRIYAVDYLDVQGPAITGVTAKEFREYQR